MLISAESFPTKHFCTGTFPPVVIHCPPPRDRALVFLPFAFQRAVQQSPQWKGICSIAGAARVMLPGWASGSEGLAPVCLVGPISGLGSEERSVILSVSPPLQFEPSALRLGTGASGTVIPPVCRSPPVCLRIPFPPPKDVVGAPHRPSHRFHSQS